MDEKRELILGDWNGGPRALFWCACFDTPCEFLGVNPRLCFDKDRTSFEEIKPEILMGNKIVGKILRLRIKEHGVTCIIESEVLRHCRNPDYDYPWDFLKFISFKSHVRNGIEIIDHLVIDESLMVGDVIEDYKVDEEGGKEDEMEEAKRD